MKAERETADRLIAHHLADRIGASFQGRISGVTRAGLFVKLDDTGADGLIPIRTLGTEYYNYDETRHALVGSRSGAMHRLGDVVDVRLVEAQPVAGALRFELLSEGQVDSARRQKERAPRPRRTRRKSRSGRAAARAKRTASRRRRKPARPNEGQVMETVTPATKSLDARDRPRREARRLGCAQARLSRPLPALRRGKAVSRLPEGRQQLQRSAGSISPRIAPTICRPIS